MLPAGLPPYESKIEDFLLSGPETKRTCSFRNKKFKVELDESPKDVQWGFENRTCPVFEWSKNKMAASSLA